MRYQSIALLLAALTFSAVSATPTPTIIGRDATPATAVLEKRACTSGVCTCGVGTPQGQYCAGPFIYECNPSGGCCSYGPSTKCKALLPSLPGFTPGKVGIA
ncbi:hypothetical protein Q9L58_009413 [Maublancomyces gigas]|uniref:Uncharacterized protein n=1 Tax=Discina gigas TaxID=1032678 RepID=A0ABR3G816_9PEZI